MKNRGYYNAWIALFDESVDLMAGAEAGTGALTMAGGNESKAAGLLDINHHTFRYRKKLHIE